MTKPQKAQTQRAGVSSSFEIWSLELGIRLGFGALANGIFDLRRNDLAQSSVAL
jgi:hypothetical protein